MSRNSGSATGRMLKVMPASAMVLAMTSLAGDATAADEWKVGTPIVTWYAGPTLSQTVVKQMADGGYNVIWCKPEDLDLLQAHGLRGMLRDESLLVPETLDDPARTEKLNAVIDRVKDHPAMYSYYITDEPSSKQFPALGKLVAHIQQRDPAHMAYINLFPTYARNEQLGNTGDAVSAYNEHLQQFIDIVRPKILSYDHYQFYKEKDGDQYFLNLKLVRESAERAGIPFLNIVQASAWEPTVRVPGEGELRYLVYTTLAYHAQGISYYVYYYRDHEGCIANADGTPTPIYHHLQPLNRDFVAIATEIQPLTSMGIYHTTLTEIGCEPVPADVPIKIGVSGQKNPERGGMISYFGPAGGQVSHVMICNLDYRSGATANVPAFGRLEQFDPAGGQWSRMNGRSLSLPPGGGVLLRRSAAE